MGQIKRMQSWTVAIKSYIAKLVQMDSQEIYAQSVSSNVQETPKQTGDDYIYIDHLRSIFSYESILDHPIVPQNFL